MITALAILVVSTAGAPACGAGFEGERRGLVCSAHSGAGKFEPATIAALDVPRAGRTTLDVAATLDVGTGFDAMHAKFEPATVADATPVPARDPFAGCVGQRVLNADGAQLLCGPIISAVSRASTVVDEKVGAAMMEAAEAGMRLAMSKATLSSKNGDVAVGADTVKGHRLELTRDGKIVGRGVNAFVDGRAQIMCITLKDAAAASPDPCPAMLAALRTGAPAVGAHAIDVYGAALPPPGTGCWFPTAHRAVCGDGSTVAWFGAGEPGLDIPVDTVDARLKSTGTAFTRKDIACTLLGVATTCTVRTILDGAKPVGTSVDAHAGDKRVNCADGNTSGAVPAMCAPLVTFVPKGSP